MGQVLTAIKVELAVAQRAMEAAGVDIVALQGARSITEGALHTVRDLSRLLHPAMLDDLGLAATVDWYLKGFGKRHGVRIELLQDRMDERLPPETEAGVYRIVQEALTNVAKHAQASTCRVFLQRLPHTAARHDRGRRDRFLSRTSGESRAPRGGSAWSGFASGSPSCAASSGWKARRARAHG